MLFQIKNLLEEGYTLEGIRKKLFPSPKEAKIKKRERASPALFPELTLPPSYSYLSESQPLKKENLKKLLKEVLEDLKEIYKSLSA
jgi:DNA-binding transcriptional MerR regulator